MGHDTGFLDTKRQAVPRREIEVRKKDYKEYDLPFTDQAIQDQGARCMECGVPFCHTGCPLGNIIPEWNDLAYRGNWKQAILRLHSTNNFPEVTGRVCPAPCEDSCVLNKYYEEDAVSIKQIEKHIIDHAFENDWIKPQPSKTKTGKKIAIVGTGPAGMAAAQQLARIGHTVTIYEKCDRAGGLMVYGIPDFKMEKHLVSYRVKQLEAEGVTFILNTEVGKDITYKELNDNNDALLIAIGAGKERPFDVPGQDLKGVHFALDYLTKSNKAIAGDTIEASEVIDAKDKTVVILGGGFTGADCLGTAVRQGAKKIYQFELFPMKPRPTPVHQEIEVDLDSSLMTTGIVGKNGVVDELRAVYLDWGNKDGKMESKRRKDEYGNEVKRILKTDLVLLATGFVGPMAESLIKELGVEMTNRGNIRTDDQLMSSVDGVFVSGDANRGASLVVWAIWEGREAARNIDKYLMGTTSLLSSPEFIG